MEEVVKDSKPMFQFVWGENYLALPRDPQPWLIDKLVPAGGLMNLYSKPKMGKALALTTPVPTPNGWTTIKHIQPGDQVFDAQGQPTTVLAVSPVEVNRACYRVKFDDGSVIVADAEHLWTVYYKGHKQTLTTATLANTKLYSMSNGYRKMEYRIPLTGALQYPVAKSLPLDPYLLGTWLGDGTGVHAAITTADSEIVTAWEAAGWRMSKRKAEYLWGICTTPKQPRPLTHLLRDLKVLGNKHIPASYMNASPEDRLALLQGLCDTDGFANAGRAEFYNTNRRLAKQVLQLARELGFKVLMTVKDAQLNGQVIGPVYTVAIRANTQVFRLTRKQTTFILNTECYRTIVSVTPTKSVPVKCLVVDNPDHLFLCGKLCIPTHNSFLALQIAIAVSNPEIPTLLDRKVVKHGKVMYLQVDTPRNDWAYRVDNLHKTGEVIKEIGFTDANLVPYPLDLTAQTVKDGLKEAILQHKPVLLVVDTLREVHNGDENDSGAMKNIVTSLVECTKDVNCTVLFISHSRKDNAFQPNESIMDDGRGSSYVSGRMDVVAKLTEKTLWLKGRSIGETKISVEHHPTTHLWTINAEKADNEKNIKWAMEQTDPEGRPLSLRARAQLLITREPDLTLEAARSLIRRRQDKTPHDIDTPPADLGTSDEGPAKNA